MELKELHKIFLKKNNAILKANPSATQATVKEACIKEAASHVKCSSAALSHLYDLWECAGYWPQPEPCQCC